jgi:hypothetical protein
VPFIVDNPVKWLKLKKKRCGQAGDKLGTSPICKHEQLIRRTKAIAGFYHVEARCRKYNQDLAYDTCDECPGFEPEESNE